MYTVVYTCKFSAYFALIGFYFALELSSLFPHFICALIREREHGTIKHLTVMLVTVFEIMLAKVLSMSLVVLLAAFLGLKVVVQGALQVPIEGSLLLFFFGALLTLFATTSMGIYMATVSKSMPQFGLLMMLILIPLQMLSGGKYTTRKHARNYSKYHVDCNDNAFCNIGASNFIPKCRIGCGLAFLSMVNRNCNNIFLCILETF